MLIFLITYHLMFAFAGSGYIDTIPLSKKISSDRSAIPRRSWEMCDVGPGVLVIPNRDRPVTDLAQLSIGDLVFLIQTLPLNLESNVKENYSRP